GHYNESWNLRVLVLMARAELITFSAHVPELLEQRENESDLDFEQRRAHFFERFSREVCVQIRDNRHSDRAHWSQVVNQTRERLRQFDRRGLEMVRELRDL